jgi:hypothetical protein
MLPTGGGGGGGELSPKPLIQISGRVFGISIMKYFPLVVIRKGVMSANIVVNN